jgi:hypothetical protein
MPTAMAAAAPAFDENYMVQWGADGRHLVDSGTAVDLAMDQNSGTYVCVHCAACKKCAQQRDFFFGGLVSCTCGDRAQVLGSGPRPRTDQGSST